MADTFQSLSEVFTEIGVALLAVSLVLYLKCCGKKRSASGRDRNVNEEGSAIESRKIRNTGGGSRHRHSHMRKYPGNHVGTYAQRDISAKSGERKTGGFFGQKAGRNTGEQSGGG